MGRMDTGGARRRGSTGQQLHPALRAIFVSALSITYSIADQNFQQTKSIGILNLSVQMVPFLARRPEVSRLQVLSNRTLRDRLNAPPNVPVLKETGRLIVTLFPALLRIMPFPDTVQRPFVKVPVLLPGVMNPGIRSVPSLLMSTTWLPVGKNTIWQGEPPTI